MFIKLGKKEHLGMLLDKGEMYFNPCKYFRRKAHQGDGDKDDGGQTLICDSVKCDPYTGIKCESNIKAHWVYEPCVSTPVFCLMQLEVPKLSMNVVEGLKKDFPGYDYALIINNEESFMEKVRYNFRNKAFAHKVFYQDAYHMDYFNFLRRGALASDILFYPPESKRQYYANFLYKGINGENISLRIDDSNVHQTMYIKKLAFQNQQEYRIVLPREHIDDWKVYSIGKLDDAKMVKIEDLVE